MVDYKTSLYGIHLALIITALYYLAHEKKITMFKIDGYSIYKKQGIFFRKV